MAADKKPTSSDKSTTPGKDQAAKSTGTSKDLAGKDAPDSAKQPTNEKKPIAETEDLV
jgi:hypothetical protein